jgi:hypothetical protein
MITTKQRLGCILHYVDYNTTTYVSDMQHVRQGTNIDSQTKWERQQPYYVAACTVVPEYDGHVGQTALL